MQPLVSIIIPAYNAGQYLAATISSALAQTWPVKEIIVVDNGSTDNTLSIIDHFGNAVIKLQLPTNKGAAAARNAGLAIAKGCYIQFLDADDLINPNKIESQLNRLQLSADYLAICRTAHFFDGEDHHSSAPLKSWFETDTDDVIDFLVKLYAGKEVLPGYGGMVALHAWLTPRKLIDKAGYWDENLSVDDDGEFFCRVVLAAKGIRYSDEALCYYRKFINGTSLSAQKGKNAVESAIKAIDLKYRHLKSKTGNKLVDQIFSRHYWWAGVLAFPQFKKPSNYCIQKALQLGYTGQKYVGGPAGHAITKVLGWRVARYVAHYREVLKKS